MVQSVVTRGLRKIRRGIVPSSLPISTNLENGELVTYECPWTRRSVAGPPVHIRAPPYGGRERCPISESKQLRKR